MKQLLKSERRQLWWWGTLPLPNIHLFHDLIPGHRVVYKPAVFSFGPSRGIRRLALMLSGIARPLQLVYVRSLITGSSFQKLLLKHLAAQIKCAGHLTFHYGANKKSRAPKNWRFQTVVLEKDPVSPLDCKEIKPVNLKRNQPWILTRRTDAKIEDTILWPPDAKSWLIVIDPNAGKN